MIEETKIKQVVWFKNILWLTLHYMCSSRYYNSLLLYKHYSTIQVVHNILISSPLTVRVHGHNYSHIVISVFVVM